MVRGVEEVILGQLVDNDGACWCSSNQTANIAQTFLGKLAKTNQAICSIVQRAYDTKKLVGPRLSDSMGSEKVLKLQAAVNADHGCHMAGSSSPCLAWQIHIRPTKIEGIFVSW